MNLTALPIQYDDLERLIPLFEKSYGAEVLLTDEQTYFDAKSAQDWIYVWDETNQKAIAFFRNYKLNDELIYIDYWLTENPMNSSFYSNIIQNFCTEILKKGKTIKWTFDEHQQVAYQWIKETGNIEEERIFYHYNLDVINYCSKLNVSSDKIYCALCTELSNSEENKQLINLFAHWTLPSLEKLKTWIQQKKLFKFQKGAQLIGAALVNDQNKQIELVQIIIRSEDRGKGYGTVCLDLLIQDIQSNYPSCQEIYLDVNQENQIARKLYKNLGFQAIRRKIYLYQRK